MEGELASLVERARRADRQAMAALYERFRPQVLRLCLSFAGLAESEAEDVLQESFVRAFRGLGKLREPERFGPWLFAIARRRCLTWMKRGGQRRAKAAAWGQEQRVLQAGPQAERESAWKHGILVEEIEAMPKSKMKTAGRLFYLEGCDTGRIAEQLDAPASSVTTWLSRFRGKLRRRLLLRLGELRRLRG
ncbi:MAG: RNA polymerase sigma factor [Deltaproteobacteria bacterium]|nr:RNA polymerase sigma factor [Deltaproteobacteria bacterium]